VISTARAWGVAGNDMLPAILFQAPEPPALTDELK
jgi:hypothetical protein